MDKKKINQKGFTLIEIVVILGVIAILVAILTPAVLKYLDDARQRRAEADVKQVAGAILALMKDTGQYPGDLSSAPECLVTDGDILSFTDITCASNAESLLSNHLIVNANKTQQYSSSGRFKWNGPYINELKPDPWGNAYAVGDNNTNLKGNNTAAVWVMSAGPNGAFDTASTATTLSGDDIGMRLK